MRALILALVLAACASPPAELPPPQLPQRTGVDPLVAARAEGVQFLAHGSAPVFQLRFYDDRITLSRDGGTALTFPRTEPIYPAWSGEIYDTEADGHRLHIEVQRYHDCPTDLGSNVVVAAIDGGERLTGCGRDV